MNEWFNSLSPRERNLVSYGSVAVIAVLLWLVVLQPLYKNKSKLNKVIAQQQTTLKKMQQQSQEIKQLQKQQQNTAKPQSISSQSPQQLIENSLNKWNLKLVLERMQSQGANGVRIILKGANANRVMQFLHELETMHGLSINNMQIDRDKKTVGLADFRLTIKRGEIR